MSWNWGFWCIDVYLFNNKTIKVVDKNGERGYFEYSDKTNDILFKEKMTKEKEKGFYFEN